MWISNDVAEWGIKKGIRQMAIEWNIRKVPLRHGLSLIYYRKIFILQSEVVLGYVEDASHTEVKWKKNYFAESNAE